MPGSFKYINFRVEEGEASKDSYAYNFICNSLFLHLDDVSYIIPLSFSHI